MFKKMKIVHKIMFLAIVIVGINLIVQANFIIKMRSHDIANAQTYMMSETQLASSIYSDDFKLIESKIKSLSDDMSIMIANGDLTRKSAIQILSNSLNEHPMIVGHGLGFEPNAFDQNDLLYRRHEQMGSDQQGRFLPYVTLHQGSPVIEVLTGFDVEGDGDWYLVPQKTLKPVVTEPYIYPVNGVDTLMFTISYPIINKGQFLGVVTADITLDHINESLREKQKNAYYDLESVIFTKEGNLVGQTFEVDPLNFDSYQLGGMKTNEAVFKNVIGLKGQQLMIVSPISFMNSESSWYLVNFVPESQILSEYKRNLIINILLIFFALVVINIIIFFIQKSIKDPMNHLIKVIKKVEEGDLTQISSVDTEDEIGEISKSFNQMIEKLKNIIHEVKFSSEVVGLNASQMNDIAQENTRSIKNVNHVVEEISHAQVKQSDEIEEIVQKTSDLSHLINEVSQFMEEVKSTTEQTESYSTRGIILADTLNEKTQSTEEKSKEISVAVESVNDLVKNISGITTMIDAIATQTNLLALNASIEAARAGDAGRGFAVVAEEIRKLAEQTSQATTEINDFISQVVTQSNATVHKASEVLNAQESQFKSIEESTEIFNIINQSFLALKNKVDGAFEKTRAVEESKDYILDTVTNISSFSEETTASMEETASMMNEQQTSMEKLNESCKGLTALTEKLKNVVSTFKA